MTLTIKKPNNVQDNLDCDLCEEVTEVPVHIAIFEDKIDTTVCQNCIKTHGPNLEDMLHDRYIDVIDLLTDGYNMPKLFIQSNNVEDDLNCYLCEEETEGCVPFEIFEAESKKRVCINCARTHAPH